MTDELIGKQLGGFRIDELIGQGGMASVYRAHQTSMDRNVAVKVLPKQFALDPNFVGRFKREARVIAQLEHNSILPVYDFGEADGYLYIAMRLVEHGTLADKIVPGQPLPLPDIRRIIGQVGDALDYAHSRGVIHRDIKPSNMLVTNRNNYLLTDFGIAKQEGSADAQFTQTGSIVGTPIYMSPEQALGKALDRRSDIYSLGVMLYQLAVGDVPYKADTPMGLVVKHIQETPPPPRTRNPSLPQAVDDVIMKSLAKSPDDRYSTMAEMVEALQVAIDRSAYGNTAESAPVSQANVSTMIDEGPMGLNIPANRPTPGTPYSSGTSTSTPNQLGETAMAPPPEKKGGLGGVFAGLGIGLVGAVGGGFLVIVACIALIWGLAQLAPDVEPTQVAVLSPTNTNPVPPTPTDPAPPTTAPDPGPTQPVIVAAPPTGSIVFEDDFSLGSSGWDTGQTTNGNVRYEEGEYVINVIATDWLVWGNANLDEVYPDLTIDVTARYTGTATNGGFGVICYYNSDPVRSFYYFEIGPDGYWVIVRVNDNDQTIVGGDIFSDSIARSQTIYQMSVSCRPGEQILVVDGLEIGRSEDTELQPGDIGLIGSSYDQPNVQIRFDDVVARIGGFDYVGSYNVRGNNPDGSAYNGTVEIVALGSGLYDVTWTINTDPVQILNGEGSVNSDGQLVITDDTGIITTYTPNADGTLAGTWVDGNNNSGTETLTRR